MGVSQTVSLSLQLLHRFALFLQSGSHRLHYGGLEKLCSSEDTMKTIRTIRIGVRRPDPALQKYTPFLWKLKHCHTTLQWIHRSIGALLCSPSNKSAS